MRDGAGDLSGISQCSVGNCKEQRLENIVDMILIQCGIGKHSVAESDAFD
jgi:hypothetical protein